MVKPVLQSQDAPAACAARHTLLHVLEALLRLMHPLMPFITEEIWQRRRAVGRSASGESIMIARWPLAADFPADAAAEQELQWVMQVVAGIRQIRGEMDIADSRRVPLLLQQPSAHDLQLLERHQPLIAHLARLASVRALGAGRGGAACCCRAGRRAGAAGTHVGPDRARQ